VQALVTSGIISELSDQSGQLWLVAAGALALGSDTLVPATAITIASPSPEDERRFNGPEVGVYPLGTVPLKSDHVVSVRDAHNALVNISRWTFTPVLGNGPESMWGQQNNGRAPLAANVTPALFGLRAVPSLPVTTGPPKAPLERLAFSRLEKRDLPLPDINPIDGSTTPGPDSWTVIAETVAKADTIAVRDGLVTILNRLRIGRDLIGGTMSLLAEDVRITFQDKPMLGPLGSTGPKRQTQKPAAPEVGSARARSSAARPPIARGPTARLGALFRAAQDRATRGRSEWCEAIVADAFTSRTERMVLDSNQVATVLGAGMAAVFDLPVESGLTLESHGQRAVSMVAFDAYDDIAAFESLPPASRWPVPREVARVAVICDADDEPAAEGWSRSSSLLLIAPQVLIGDRVVVRAQAPLRVRRGRSDRARGVISGATLARQNRTLDRAIEAGWTRTTVRRASIITVSLGADGAERDTSGGTELLLSPLHDAGRPPIRLRPQLGDDSGETMTLTYRVPADLAGPISCFVRPPAGYRHEGLEATVARRSRRSRRAVPSRSVAEVRFR
jgi:hypothetical protein